MTDFAIISPDALRTMIREEVTAAMRASADNDLLTRTEVSKLLGIHPKSVSRLVRRGALRGTRVGRVWRFRRQDVMARMAEVG